MDHKLKIPYEMLAKYGIGDTEGTVELYKLSSEYVYRLFLRQTDYICCKIVEGVSTKEDYAEELYYRQTAREEIEKENDNEE